MTIAQGVNKQTRIARQAAKGTLASTGGGQILRRKQSTFGLQKETYSLESEITSSQQLQGFRHGAKQVPGKLSGIFTPGTYADLFSQLLRKDFVAGGTATGLTDVTAAVTSGYSGTFTRVSGSWLTNGFRIGQVVRPSGFATTGASNNGRNFLITGLTATVMTVLSLTDVAVGAKAAGDTVAFATPGKVTWIPDTGHTTIYNTVEEWFPDASISEQFSDVMVASADVKCPGSGNAEVDFAFTGLAMVKATSAYYTSPAVETSSDALVAASGKLLLGGSAVATVTDLSYKIDGKVAAADPVNGSDQRPDVFRGKVMVTGQFTAYFEDYTIADLFINETEAVLVSALRSGLAAGSDFCTVVMPKIKVGSSDPDDNETGLKRTYTFTATYYAAGGTGIAYPKTTLFMHDSLAA